MKTVSVISQEHGQTVCLPEEFRLDTDEAYIKRVGQSLLLIPKHTDPWQSLVDSLGQFSEDYLADRSQPDSQQNHAAPDAFLVPLAIVDFDPSAADCYGRIRADLERQGTPIGPLDTLIAAHALSLGLPLVTNNTAEFRRVPGLVIEDWTQP
jgi:tRNA(fMet)-specific endonuclease VapC